MNVYAEALDLYIPFFAAPYIATEIFRIKSERPRLNVGLRLIEAACVILVGHFLLIINIFLSGVTIVGLVMGMTFIASTLSLLGSLNNPLNKLRIKIINGCLFCIMILFIIGWFGMVVKGAMPLWLSALLVGLIALIMSSRGKVSKNDANQKPLPYIKNSILQVIIISTLVPFIWGSYLLFLLIQRGADIEHIFWDFLTNNFQSLYNQV